MSPQARRLLAAVFLFLYAFGLRVTLLGKHPFHMDEALYASFSQRILHGDLLLTGGMNNDKPPLQFYLGAVGMALFGDGESAIRAMNCLVSSLECAALCWFLWPLCGTLISLMAGLLLAGAPLAAGYGASALMDGPMSLFLLLAFCLAASSRPWAAGLAWGLACACKQTAWFLGPFLALTVWMAGFAPHSSLKQWAKGAAAALVPLFIWSLLFQHPRLGMIFLMKANQPEVGHAWGGLGTRFAQWLAIGGSLYEPQALFALALWGGLAFSAFLAWRWRDDHALRAWSLAGFFGPLCLLLFAALNMRFFDRYLLPLASFGLMALALGLAYVTRERRGLRLLLLPCMLLAVFANRGLSLPPSQEGVGFAANDGFDRVAALLKSRSPGGGKIFSNDGSVQWMSAYYLAKGWQVVEISDSHELMQRLGAETGPEAWLLLRPGEALLPPKGWNLDESARLENWVLTRARRPAPK